MVRYQIQKNNKIDYYDPIFDTLDDVKKFWEANHQKRDENGQLYIWVVWEVEDNYLPKLAYLLYDNQMFDLSLCDILT